MALHCRDDAFHAWSREQFAQINGALLTCEAVVAETCFLLARGGHDPAKALALVARGVVRVVISLGDACLVRMSELYARSRVFTLDADFHIYRRHGRRVIPVLSPY